LAGKKRISIYKKSLKIPKG